MISIKEIFFFIILFSSYIFFFILSNHFGINTNSGKMILILCSVFGTCGLYGYAHITGLFKESFCLTSGKLCQGGLYMNQGNSETSKKCRELLSSQKGIEEINKYKCGKYTHNGYPNNKWSYTPLSDDKWTNQRCNQ